GLERRAPGEAGDAGAEAKDQRVNATISPRALAVLLAALATAPLAAQGPPDRSHPPQLGPTPELKLPPIQRFTLSNGLAVVLLEKHQVPLVHLNVMVQAGAIMDPPGKSGTAAMTAAMLDEGAGNRNALEVSDAV